MFTQEDIDWLARVVYSEARGEPYAGQVAVAAVVLNRVFDSGFPNTVWGVIFQPLAFTAVADGQINLTPNATLIKLHVRPSRADPLVPYIIESG